MTSEVNARSAAERIAEKRYPVKPPSGTASQEKKILAHVRGVVLSVTKQGELDLVSYRYDRNNYDFFIGSATKNLTGDLSPMTMFDAIVDCSAGMRFALVVMPTEQYALFNWYESLSEKLQGIDEWLSLPETKRNAVLTRRQGTLYPVIREDKSNGNPFQDLVNQYRFAKGTYTEAQQSAIDQIIRSHNPLLRRGDEHSLKRLEYLVNISPVSPSRGRPTYEDLFSAMDRSVYGQKKAKQKLALTALAGSNKAQCGFKCIIVGANGMGKEALAVAMAKGLQLPFERYSLSGVSTAVDIAGEDPSYDHSEPGPLAQIFKRFGTTEMTLILTDIDKLATGTINGDPRHAISSLFQGVSMLEDRFLDVPIDCSNTWIIATAESLRSLPGYLTSNATIIHLEPYSIEDKESIVREHMLPQIMSDFGLETDSIAISDNAMRRLVTETCELGMDQIRTNVQDCVGHMKILMHQSNNSSGVIGEAVIDEIITPFRKTDDPIYRFNQNEHLYSPRVREEFLRICEDLADDQLEPGKRRTLRRKLEILSALIPGRKDTPFDAEALRKQLDQTHFGQDEVKERLVNALNAYMRKGSSAEGFRIAFSGPAGSGKTSIAQSLASALGVPFTKISLNGLNDPTVLKGTHLEEGRIMSELAKAGSLSAVLLLDEADKCGPMVAKTLVDLLDDSNLFTDNLFGFPVSLRSVKVIVTFNDPSLVDPFVLDRLTVIEVPGYTLPEKTEIIRSYLVPSLAKQYGVQSLTMDDQTVEYLIRNYGPSVGVRDAKKACRTLIEALLRQYPEQDTFAVSDSMIAAALGQRVSHCSVPTKAVAGYVNALGVSGNLGMVFPIEVLFTDEEGLTVTGLPQETVLYSVSDAAAMLNHVFPEHSLPKGIHLRFGPAGVKKDGPSAGLAIAMAMLSASIGSPVDPRFAFTGEIDLHGNVLPVGGVPTKIHGAYLAGCKTVFIPEGNASEIERRGLSSYPTMEIIPIHGVEEVADIVFPNLR